MTSSPLLSVPADALSDRELLMGVREWKQREDEAAAAQLVLAAAWADRHPPESIIDSACFTAPGSEHEEPIAGEGCPSVAEFSVAEFGAVLGLSSTAAKRMIGHALELRHRLPRLWARVQAGEVAAWRARRVAEATIHACPSLTIESAAWVDAQVAPFAERIGVAQLDRTVEEAIVRQGPVVLPEDPERPDPPCPDSRHVTLVDEHIGWGGTMRVEAELDLADALDLDHALKTGAAELAALGSQESLDGRRATALGHLARHQLALDLYGAGAIGQTDPPAESARLHTPDDTTAPALPTARELVLHLHLAADVLGDGSLAIDPLGRMEEGQRLLLLDQIRSWCGDSHTRVSVKPVIDLNAEVTTVGYRPTTRQIEAVQLRDGTCVFPWCTRPARRCDVDHVIPYDHDAETEGRPQPGPTTTSNLASLCRFHHRLKTHGRWRVEALAPGVLHWTSPHGHQFLHDPSGTTAVDGVSIRASSLGPTRPPKDSPARPPDRD